MSQIGAYSERRYFVFCISFILALVICRMAGPGAEMSCAMCSFRCDKMTGLVQHTVRYHRYDPRFKATCRHEGCGASYSSWLSFKSHIFRKHRNAVAPADPALPEAPEIGDDVDFDNDIIGDVVMEVGEAPLDSSAETQAQYVAFLQGVREGCNISQRATDKISEGVMKFADDNASFYKDLLMREAGPGGMITAERIQEIFEQFKPSDSIQLVGSKHLMDRYLIQRGFLQMPRAVQIDEVWVWAKKPTLHLVKKPLVFYEVPFLKCLEQLLNQEDILFCVDNPRANNEEVLKDYSDGAYFKAHPIFGNVSRALQIILYYDDIEIVNPLGSKVKKHKLAMFYWSLGNIYPEYRSTLRVINLLCIVKTTQLRKYGINKVLENFVQAIKLLESANGVSFTIHGVERVFRGSLLMFVGDTLASNYVGGFKEGSGFAKRPCRSCMGTQTTIRTKFVANQFLLRDKIKHTEHCESINEPGLTKEAKTFWSKEFGITARSVLCDIDSFDITKCLVQDLMHVVIEGPLELECRHFLTYCIANKLLTLKQLNDNILKFDYGHLSKDKPSEIERQHLENKLRQNCVQLITLGNSLPFLVSDKIEPNDERLLNFTLLTQILNVMLSFELTPNDAILLQTMIDVHHRNFVLLYPDRKPTPKFHFMVHLPSQILSFGPLRHQWCMRFEGAHCRFKLLASVGKCFKNIPLTLAYRHQSLRCAEFFQMRNAPQKKTLYRGDIVSSGSSIKVGDHPLSINVKVLLGIEDDEKMILSTRQCIVHGTVYKIGSVILTADDDDDLPVFGEVFELLVYGDKKAIVYKEYKTGGFYNNLNAYEVFPTIPNNLKITSLDSLLLHPHPLSFSTFHGTDFVILLNHRRNEFGAH